MPARSILYTLAELSTASQTSVGTTGVLLGSLWRTKVPVPPTICIPIQSLRDLASNPQLHLKLEQLQRNRADLHKAAQLDKITYLLRQLALDRSFLLQLAHLYHEYLQGKHVQVYLSDGAEHAREQLVLGDATIAQAVLKVWAQSIVSELSRSPKSKPIQEIIAPSAILLTQQPQPVAAGQIATRDPQNNDKTKLIITACWGAMQSVDSNSGSEIVVDVRTNTVVKHTLHTQETKQVYGVQELIQAPLAPSEVSTHPISDSDAISLCTYALQLKRQTLEHLMVSWIKTEDGLFLTGVSELEFTHNEDLFEAPNEPQKVITKLYVTGGNPKKAAEHLSQPVDGVGLLRSEYFLAQYGIHPQHLLQSHQRESLRQSMLATIHAYQAEARGSMVLFRTENFTSAELLKLKFSSSHTEREPNPYLGLRGGLKQLSEPDLFTFQLEVFREALEKSTSPLGLMIPFIRSAEEGRRLLQFCTELRLEGKQFAGIWFQLNTPENILQLRDYPISHLAGVVFNVSSVMALATGVDPDRPEIANQYPFALPLFTTLLQQLVAVRSDMPQLQILAYFSQFNPEAATAAVQAGVQGIIVRPSVASVAKVSIMEAEAERILKPSFTQTKSKEHIWQ